MKKGRPAKVCEVCLGNAETTRDECKCNGVFGSKECNNWLWGWFVVDDTVHRAAKSYKEAANSTEQPCGENNKSMPKLSLTFEAARKELLNRSFVKHIPKYGESMLKSFYDIIVGNKKR